MALCAEQEKRLPALDSLDTYLVFDFTFNLVTGSGQQTYQGSKGKALHNKGGGRDSILVYTGLIHLD